VPSNLQPYLSLAAGWSDRQTSADGGLSRAVSVAPNHPAQVYLHHPQGKPLVLEITAMAESPQLVTLLANGEVTGQIEITRNFESHSFDLPRLTAEVMTLKFQSDHSEGSISVSRLGLREGE